MSKACNCVWQDGAMHTHTEGMSSSIVPAVCCRQRGVWVKYEPVCPLHTDPYSLQVDKWDIRLSRSRGLHHQHDGIEGEVNSEVKRAIFQVLVTFYIKRGGTWSCTAWTILTHSLLGLSVLLFDLSYLFKCSLSVFLCSTMSVNVSVWCTTVTLI